ncbi:hypothetical protein HMPREF9080_01902 [Cardiobacterium valvarum F0432]|uniref:Uncharacterized protein n=1 Tax=Cardiobacterium valvarum F0432 TaxID=797473 RepID=G9ZGJ8_9GAMM|nr:hypothetical protein HMPREF9080_01902 [Cardiobacterium valvarum F0432]
MSSPTLKIAAHYRHGSDADGKNHLPPCPLPPFAAQKNRRQAAVF